MLSKLMLIILIVLVLLIASIYISFKEQHTDTPITESIKTYKVCGLGGCHYTEWYKETQGCVYYGEHADKYNFRICGTYSIEKVK